MTLAQLAEQRALKRLTRPSNPASPWPENKDQGMLEAGGVPAISPTRPEAHAMTGGQQPIPGDGAGRSGGRAQTRQDGPRGALALQSGDGG